MPRGNVTSDAREGISGQETKQDSVAQPASNADTRFEALLELCGNDGRWQWRILLLTSLVCSFNTLHTFGSIFLGATPDFWCTPDNATESQMLRGNSSQSAMQCERKISDGNGSLTTVDCQQWTFDTSRYKSTIVTEWSLVCGRRALYSTVQASFMLGKLVFYPVCGALSDWWGRRRVALPLSILFLLVGCAIPLSTHYAVFIVLRILLAMTASLCTPLYTLTMEVFAPRLRAYAGILIFVPFSLNMVVLSGIAYLIRDWRYLQLAISLPSVVGVVAVYWLPESPRWLAAHGNANEALEVLKSIARVNKKELPSDEELLRELELCRRSEEKPTTGLSDEERYSRFGGPVMRRRMLASAWVYIVTNLMYYGVQFDAAQLSGNPFLALTLSGLVQAPANFVGVPIVNRFGRRLGTATMFLVTGAFILAILAVPEALSWPKLVLSVIANMIVTVAFNVIWMYVTEFTPTPLRTVGLCLCTSVGRIGSVIAPYVVDLLAPVHWTLPSCVFGTAALSGAMVVLLLPETVGRRLPETVRDVETRSWETPLAGKGKGMTNAAFQSSGTLKSESWDEETVTRH